ncbi:MAG: DNA-directed RNA polymerase subunit alpha [Puniceicoccales bacterium]|jgi:DNA-directed RNA polymerase subunit alpha|nr:DNA-directed RNA polymerase subunit alpha [Puniceicoccales bacterium]
MENTMTRTLGKFELPTRVAKVENSATKTYAAFVVEPFESGFGYSIGNTLRRILLGAIEGTALTNVRIAEVQHEFQTIPGIVEDVFEILLNLKKVLFQSECRTAQTLTLDISNREVARAKDITVPSGVQVLNPEHILFHTNGKGRLSAEMRLNRGRGYRLADENEKLDAIEGGIALDSSFSPVRLVNYTVENARVGQVTDFDRLTLEISTDSRISPEDALAESVAILRLHLSAFDNLAADDITFEQDERSSGGDQNRLQKLLAMSVNEIELSVRAANCLNNANILTVGELAAKTEGEMLRYRNFGKKSLTEIKNRLEELGLSLGMKIDECL